MELILLALIVALLIVILVILVIQLRKGGDSADLGAISSRLFAVGGA